MDRLQLFEFEDLSWFPKVIRKGMTDYLRFVFSSFHIYDRTARVLQKVMDETQEDHIIDLCTGSGGGIISVLDGLQKGGNTKVVITLTDKYPNINTYRYLQKNHEGSIRYEKQPVDAMDVPPTLKGIRTLYTAFHHFDPPQALRILKNAVKSKAPVCIFEGAERNYLWIAFVILVTPILCFLMVPFIRPFKFSRLFFTYIIPLIPICAMWDGVVSFLRLYSTQELKQMVLRTKSWNYNWKIGKLRHPLGFKIVYLVGYPLKS